MSTRTQMRLQQLTGSLSSVQSAVAALEANSLQGVLDHVASGIKRIHGGDAFHSQNAGVFSHLTSSFEHDVKVVGSLEVDVEARLASAKVEDLTSGRIVYAAAGGELVDSSALAFDGTDLIAGSAKVSDLTATRVVYVGLDGALVDSSEMTFGAAGLTLAKDLSARSGSFSGDLTVTGNFFVNGAMTYVNTADLKVTDKKIVIADGASGANLDGAGIYLGSDANVDESIRWNHADTKWIASDKFAADTLQALDLSEAIVWADASGNLVEITAQQMADAMEARLAAGTGVSISEAGAAITIAIGQPVATTDAVTFAVVTGSNLTANRLMASNGAKGMVSADLAAWVAGTANQVVVTDDLDGSVTLSLPQDIHSGASPEFLALNLAAYGDLVADGSNFKIAAAAELLLSGADGQYQFAEAGDRAAFATRYGASETVIGAINALGNAAGLTNKFSFDVTGVIAADTDVTFTGLDVSAIGNTDDKKNKRLDVYVNGQLLRLGASYDYVFGTGVNQIKFKFALQADDIATVVVR